MANEAVHNEVVASIERKIILVVKALASRAGDTGIDLRFGRSTQTGDRETVTLVASLPDAWRYRVRTRTGWSSVSVL